MWFDINGRGDSCVEFETNSIDNGPEYNRHLIGKLPFIYLLLQEQKFEEMSKHTNEYIDSIKESKKSESLLKEIKDLRSYESEDERVNLKDFLEGRVEQNLLQYKLEKFRPYEVPNTHVSEYYESNHAFHEDMKFLSNGLIDYYHQILDADNEMFEDVRQVLKSFPEYIEHSEERIELKQDEKVSVHLALNSYDFVQQDNNEVFEWYGRQEIQLNDVQNNPQRIEIWSNHTGTDTGELRKKILTKLRNEISDKIFIPGRAKLYENK